MLCKMQEKFCGVTEKYFLIFLIYNKHNLPNLSIILACPLQIRSKVGSTYTIQVSLHTEIPTSSVTIAPNFPVSAISPGING